MFKTILVLVAVVLFGAGCGVLPEVPETLEEAIAIAPEEGHAVDVTDFPDAERQELATCFAAWRDFSAGKVRLRATVGGDDAALTAHRGRYEGREVLAYVSFAKRGAWFDVDGMPGYDIPGMTLHGLCLNAVGVALGIQGHAGVGAMTDYADSVRNEFTPDDRAACVAAGVCE